MAKKKVTVGEPSLADEVLLNDVVEDAKSEVLLGGRRWKVGYLRNGTKRKVTSLMLDGNEDETKVLCKASSLLLLNGYFKIVFLHWALWRWFYYVREYSDKELLEVVDACKKKVDVESYCVATIYLTEMKDTLMSMTRGEVDRFRRASSGERPGTSERSTANSPEP